MRNPLQEKIQITVPTKDAEPAEGWASFESARDSQAGVPSFKGRTNQDLDGNKFNMMPPGMELNNQCSTEINRMPFVMSGEGDVSKDTNHCPTNFIQSILAALPMDRRVMLVNKWLMPVDLSCRPAGLVDSGDLECAQVQRFQAIVKAASGAQTSVAELLDGIDPGELERAHFELTNAMDVLGRELRLVEQKRAEQGTPGDRP